MAIDERPLLRVVRGSPDDVELAALTAVIAGIVASGGDESDPELRAPWSNPGAMVRRPTSHGHGAWRASGLPG